MFIVAEAGVFCVCKQQQMWSIRWIREPSVGEGDFRQCRHDDTGAGGVLLLFVENCQETSDTANKHSLELCASIVLVFLGGCCMWCVCDVFLTGLVLGNWYP